jgi:flagellar motor switch protein FliM
MTVQKKSSGTLRASAAEAEVYDFKRPTTLAREQSRILELVFETFARQWGTQLTAKVRVVSRVALEAVIMQTYDDYASSLPATTAMVLCNVDGLEARAVLQFPASAALNWVARMFGSSGKLEAPERKFTPIETAIVRRLMDDALEDLRYSFGAMLAIGIAVDTIHYNSQFAQAAATTDFMVVARFTVRVGDFESEATLAIPADVLLPQLGEHRAPKQLASSPDLLRAQLATVPVGVSLQLDPVFVSPSVVLGLVEGDLIRIPHPQHRPLNVAVDGHTVAKAAVGANGARLACVVVETQEAS